MSFIRAYIRLYQNIELHFVSPVTNELLKQIAETRGGSAVTKVMHWWIGYRSLNEKIIEGNLTDIRKVMIYSYGVGPKSQMGILNLRSTSEEGASHRKITFIKGIS